MLMIDFGTRISEFGFRNSDRGYLVLFRGLKSEIKNLQSEIFIYHQPSGILVMSSCAPGIPFSGP
jgi:hypothetical protein